MTLAWPTGSGVVLFNNQLPADVCGDGVEAVQARDHANRHMRFHEA